MSVADANAIMLALPNAKRIIKNDGYMRAENKRQAQAHIEQARKRIERLMQPDLPGVE